MVLATLMEIGRIARGNLSDRMSPRFCVMEFADAMMLRFEKLKTNTPMVRKDVKFSTPPRVPMSTPKDVIHPDLQKRVEDQPEVSEHAIHVLSREFVAGCGGREQPSVPDSSDVLDWGQENCDRTQLRLVAHIRLLGLDFQKVDGDAVRNMFAQLARQEFVGIDLPCMAVKVGSSDRNVVETVCGIDRETGSPRSV